MNALYPNPDPVWTAFGLLAAALGFSFLYKGWNALVLGRIHYWSGFLPLTLLSPFLIHLPTGKNSLIKTKEGLVSHMLVGPMFFLAALPLLVLGADLLGLGGTSFANQVLNIGSATKAPAIVYSPPIHYDFPIVSRSSEKMNAILNDKLPEDPTKTLLPAGHGTVGPADQQYK
jgi:hypothetical protein